MLCAKTRAHHWPKLLHVGSWKNVCFVSVYECSGYYIEVVFVRLSSLTELLQMQHMWLG